MIIYHGGIKPAFLKDFLYLLALDSFCFLLGSGIYLFFGKRSSVLVLNGLKGYIFGSSVLFLGFGLVS